MGADPRRRNGDLAAGRTDFEPHAFLLLEIGHDIEQVTGLRIAFRTKHAHQALRRSIHDRAKLFEPDRRVDVIAQNGLAGFHVAGKKSLDAFAKKCSTKIRIALRAGSNCFLEISGQHTFFLFKNIFWGFMVLLYY